MTKFMSLMSKIMDKNRSKTSEKQHKERGGGGSQSKSWMLVIKVVEGKLNKILIAEKRGWKELVYNKPFQ